MLDTLTPQRTVIDGVPHWQYPDGRVLPIMAGGDGSEGDGRTGGDGRAGDDAAATAAAEAEAAARAEADAAAAAAAEADGRRLGPNGEAALDAERKSNKELKKQLAAERRAREALENEKLSETERLKKEAEQGRTAAATATAKLRKANLRDALAEKKIGNAKAVAKLLDGLEYDDDDEPTNLDAVLRAAKKEYGDALFGPVKPPPPNVNGGEGGSRREPPTLTAEQLRYAELMGMSAEEYAAHLTDPGAGALGPARRSRT